MDTIAEREHREFCPIQRISTGKVHLVYADGGPESGSLYGFSTLCGYRIENIEEWLEFDTAATCKLCLAVTWRALVGRGSSPQEPGKPGKGTR